MSISPYWSNFGGLWIDRTDFDPSSVSEDVRRFVQNGYLIIENAVGHDLIDRFLEDVSVLRRQRGVLIGQGPDGITADPGDDMRILDVHANTKSALPLMFAPLIRHFLEKIFETSPLAFQTLLFTYGSEQGLHQDPAYVVVGPPLHLAASWIALEDVEPGSGELIYNVGSHRNEDFCFGANRKHFLISDGIEQHDAYSRHLNEQRLARNQEQKPFIAKKGDVLIWHADLAHGGLPRTTDHTRRSLVTHYCPITATPHYFNWKKFNVTRSTQGSHFASSWYDLSSEIEEDGMFRRPVF